MPTPLAPAPRTDVFIDWPRFVIPPSDGGATAAKPTGGKKVRKKPPARGYDPKNTYHALIGQVNDRSKPFLDVTAGGWKKRFESLLSAWRAPAKAVPPPDKIPFTLVVTQGSETEFNRLQITFERLAEQLSDLANLSDGSWQRDRNWLDEEDWAALADRFGPEADYALACLILSAKLRWTYSKVTTALAVPETLTPPLRGDETLGRFVHRCFLAQKNENPAINPGNLVLFLLQPGTTSGRKGVFDLCLAAEHLDRVDERTFRSLCALLSSAGPDELLPFSGRASHAALSELGYSGLTHGLDKWLRKYPRIAPLNTFDSALTPGGSDDLLKSHFKPILSRTDPSKGPVAPIDPGDDEIEKVKYILSLATGVANFQIEGRPSYFTLLLTREPIKDPPIENLTELFRYAPGIPLQYRNKRLRSAIESSPSPNFVLCASLRSMRVERCFSYCGAKDDVFRRLHFSDKIAKFHGVVIHTHQSGSVEVYNSAGLCLLGQGIQWIVQPYDKLRQHCTDFFIGRSVGVGELAWRVCGIVANLVEQRASSILLFAKKNTIKTLAKQGVLTNMQANTLQVDEDDDEDEADDGRDGLCVKSKFYFEDVCRFLQIDGAHAVSKTGKIIRFGLKIRDAESDNKLGGTGKSATKTIAQKIYDIEKESSSFVVKVSGSGYYSLYKHGQQVTTPFDE